MLFSGEIGFWVEDKPKYPGSDVFVPEIKEEHAKGQIITDSRRFSNVTDQQNTNFVSNTRISVKARGYLKKYWNSVKYVVWNGTKFQVTSVQNNYPRITLELGGVYHGETKAKTNGYF